MEIPESCGKCEYLTEDYCCGKTKTKLSILSEEFSLMTQMFMVRNHIADWCPIKNDWSDKKLEEIEKELLEKIGG